MNFKIRKIQIDELVLYPSINYCASVAGIFDIEKTNELADITEDGAVWGGNKVEPKKITLNVGIKKYNNINLHMQLYNILARKSQILKVSYDVIGDTEIEVYVESKISKVDFTGEISVTFVAPDPYVKVSKEEIILGCFIEKGLKFPNKTPLKFGIGDSTGTAILNNKSYNTEYPVIELLTAIGWISITNQTTKQSFSLSLNSNLGDKIIIDSRPLKQGIYINGKRDNYKKLDWFRCLPGNNVFTVNSNVNNSRIAKIMIEGRML